MISTRKRQNFFEVDNARNLSRDELIATFVPTQSFWRLISAKNHVVLGSRGSGKTALVKMLSHDHLSRMQDRRAQSIIRDRDFIGIYVPTELEWVSGLRNKPWQTEAQKEDFFQWRLNLSTCVAFVATLRSCLEQHTTDRGKRAVLEAAIATEIGDDWSNRSRHCENLRQLEKFLQDTERARQLQLAEVRTMGNILGPDDMVGLVFATDLFSPLRSGIRIVSEILKFPRHTSWLVCIDEAEFLDELHHRILNSHLRAFSKELFFKITTMPYYHYTLATNTGAPLNVGHDFEYVYIDQDPVIWAGGRDTEGKQFADMLFAARAKISGRKYQGVNLTTLLGQSRLLEPKDGDWSASSFNMRLLRRYANRETRGRARRLASNPMKFMDQIGRKIIPALLLRQAIHNQKGRGETDVYAGEMMAIRCGDANPRRLIRLFNKFLMELPRPHGRARSPEKLPIPAKQQTRIFKDFSASTLSPVYSEEVVGPELFSLLERVGSYMRQALHAMPVSSDQVSSIRVNLEKSEHAHLIKKAVALGLLFPNKSVRNPDPMPKGESKFHLAYVLAPRYDILPRRGKAVRLSTILRKTTARDPAKPIVIQNSFEFDTKSNAI